MDVPWRGGGRTVEGSQETRVWVDGVYAQAEGFELATGAADEGVQLGELGKL